jgi:hypothetical protein
MPAYEEIGGRKVTGKFANRRETATVTKSQLNPYLNIIMQIVLELEMIDGSFAFFLSRPEPAVVDGCASKDLKLKKGPYSCQKTQRTYSSATRFLTNPLNPN